MDAYGKFLLEIIAWRLWNPSMELAEFRKHLEALYASTSQSSPGEVIRGDSRGPEESSGVQRSRGKNPPSWGQRLGITIAKKET
jgi:hypothetical protein